MFAAIDTTKLLSESGMTVLIGIVVVFGALLVLTFVFWLFGVVARAGKKSEAAPQAPAKSSAPVSAPTPAPVVEDGVSDEVVAVIAAAIAAMSDGTTTYAIRRIRPAARTSSRPVWAAAGIADNTRPF
jgi:sodium pump decarboxylase gamma subunit